MHYTSWFYVLSVAIFLLICIYLALSKFADFKLGPKHAKPQYSYISWFAMLFSAGIGLSLVFFGVAEPVMHYIKPPEGSGYTVLSAKEAINITFFHWGLHAWGIYAIVGVMISYFSYRYDLPLTLRSCLYPIYGRNLDNKLGNTLDTFAIICTVFGIATSLGYGVIQLNTGLSYLFGFSESILLQISIILIISLMAGMSLYLGLDKGIKTFSQINVMLAFLLMLLILILGPTVFLFDTFVQNIGIYLSSIAYKTFNLYAYNPTDWIGGWTLLYWGWWISWSPFVGMFIARISYGRTIREFMCGVIIVPVLMTFVWITIFGNSALYFIMQDGAKNFAEAINNNVAIAIFKFLEFFPLSNILSIITIFIILIFFITSFDSGAMVVDELSSNQNSNSNSSIWQKLYWIGLISLVSGSLLIVGGMEALQTATIASALPFDIILLSITALFLNTLRIEYLKQSSKHNNIYNINNWQDRINNLLNYSSLEQTKNFIKQIAKPAINKIYTELKNRGLEVELQEQDNSITLIIKNNKQLNNNKDFIYFIYSIKLSTSKFINNNHHYRAEVFLQDGGQDYDINGYSINHIIHDVITHYEKHIYFLKQIRA